MRGCVSHAVVATVAVLVAVTVVVVAGEPAAVVPPQHGWSPGARSVDFVPRQQPAAGGSTARLVPIYRRLVAAPDDEPALFFASSNRGDDDLSFGARQRRGATGLPRDVFMFGGINTTFEFAGAVELGAARELFTVQLDTGSSVLAVPAAGCQTWGPQASGQDGPTGQPCRHPRDRPWDPLGGGGGGGGDDEGEAGAGGASAQAVPCGSECPGGKSACVVAATGLPVSSSSSSPDVHPSSVARADAASTSAATQCGFALSYGDGSYLLGTLWRDSVTLGGLTAPDVQLGGMLAQRWTTGAKATDVDGIMGLAYTALNPSNGQSVFEQLAAVPQLDLPDAFAMCLGTAGGVLQLGGADARFHEEGAPTLLAPMSGSKPRTFYQVNMTGFAVGGERLPGLARADYAVPRTIVDSGTTLFHLDVRVFTAVQHALKEYCPRFTDRAEQSACYNSGFFDGPIPTNISMESVERVLPNLTLYLQGVGAAAGGANGDGDIVLNLAPRDYVLASPTGSAANQVVFGLSPAPLNSPVPNILGDVVMRGYNVLFDRARDRLGFTRVDRAACAVPAASALTVALDSGDGQIGAMGHPYDDPLAVSVRFAPGGGDADDASGTFQTKEKKKKKKKKNKTLAAGGMIVEWAADRPVRFGASGGATASPIPLVDEDSLYRTRSAVDPATGLASIEVTPEFVGGAVTITAAVVTDVAGERLSQPPVVFTLTADRFTWWELLLIIAGPIVCLAVVVLTSIVVARRTRNCAPLRARAWRSHPVAAQRVADLRLSCLRCCGRGGPERSELVAVGGSGRRRRPFTLASSDDDDDGSGDARVDDGLSRPFVALDRDAAPGAQRHSSGSSSDGDDDDGDDGARFLALDEEL